MSFQKDMFNLIARFAGQANTIAVPRVFCQFAGSLEAGTLLSQMLYWSDRGNDPDGWFYKSYVEWQEEVFLTEYQVRKITKQFEEMGLLETKLKKANGAPTLHYRIRKTEFSESILEFFRIHDSENLKNPSSNIQESITETTTKTTARESVAAQPTHEPAAQAEILRQFVELKQANEPGVVINYGREGRSAKALASQGWTAAQVCECGRLLYAEPFYRDKPLSLATIAAQIGAKLKRPAAAPPPSARQKKKVIIDNVYTGQQEERYVNA